MNRSQKNNSRLSGSELSRWSSSNCSTLMTKAEFESLIYIFQSRIKCAVFQSSKKKLSTYAMYIQHVHAEVKRSYFEDFEHLENEQGMQERRKTKVVICSIHHALQWIDPSWQEVSWKKILLNIICLVWVGRRLDVFNRHIPILLLVELIVNTKK